VVKPHTSLPTEFFAPA